MENDLKKDLIPIINNMGLQEWKDKRDKSMFVFKKFFSSPSAVGEGKNDHDISIFLFKNNWLFNDA